MSVLAEATGRGDVLLRRGVTNRWGVRWQQSTDGVYFSSVDLTAWTGVLELRGPSGERWLERLTTTDVTGLAVATVTPEDLAGPEWNGRAGGAWLINLTAPDGHIERLADGYFLLEA